MTVRKAILSTSVRNFALNLSLLVGGLAAAFILAEASLRIYNPFESRLRSDRIILPANKKYVFDNSALRGVDGKIIHTKNSLGFRGAEPPVNSGDYLSIIIVGGSTTECFYVSDDKTWPARLYENLNADFERVWVNNAGLDGHSTFGHAILMRDYITKLKPRVVIFLVGGNDIARDDISHRDLAHIKVGAGAINGRRLLRAATAESALLSLLQNLYRYSRAKAAGLAHGNVDFAGGEAPIITEHYKEALADGERLRRLLVEYEGRLKELVLISRESDIEPVFVTQPSLYSAEVEAVDDGGRTSRRNLTGTGAEIAREILNLYNAATKRTGKKEGCLVIDLADKMPSSSKYFYDWWHYNNDGCRKVAEIIHNDIRPFLVSKYPRFARKSVKTALN